MTKDRSIRGSTVVMVPRDSRHISSYDIAVLFILAGMTFIMRYVQSFVSKPFNLSVLCRDPDYHMQRELVLSSNNYLMDYHIYMCLPFVFLPISEFFRTRNILYITNIIFYYTFGLYITTFLTEFLRYVIRSPRPFIMSIPEIYEIYCQIPHVPANPIPWNELTLSCPDFHATIISYAYCFILTYSRTRLIKPIRQQSIENALLVIVLVPSGIAVLMPAVENYAFIRDVIFGALLGVTIAYSLSFVPSHKSISLHSQQLYFKRVIPKPRERLVNMDTVRRATYYMAATDPTGILNGRAEIMDSTESVDAKTYNDTDKGPEEITKNENEEPLLQQEPDVPSLSLSVARNTQLRLNIREFYEDNQPMAKISCTGNYTSYHVNNSESIV